MTELASERKKLVRKALPIASNGRQRNMDEWNNMNNEALSPASSYTYCIRKSLRVDVKVRVCVEVEVCRSLVGR